MVRALSFSGLVWVHAGVQLFAYTLALAAFGIGVWMATYTHQVCNLPSMLRVNSCFSPLK